ncbi:MBL fold metallo-hydrolase [Sphingobacteriaceae bacterium]|nr:MBL fold metallo-hydrolase [Sphingobacteriaceae bacterium]
MKLKFIGATEGVTGSKHLLITEKGKHILLDCGLYQGMGKDTDAMNRNLGVNAAEIDAVILSHGHIDHCGNLPSLVKQGFSGKIYCTPATFDVCGILLLDSAHIHESDIRFINRRRKKNGESEIKPLYSVREAEKCLKQFKAIPFDTDFHLNDEIAFRFKENGHIIGSATVNVIANENGKTTRLAFTGDIGRYSDPLLKPPAVFPQADYIICESTYGDRLHDPLVDAEDKLLEILQRTCVDNKGKLIIPAFSLGRTQEILYLFDKLKKKGHLPDVKLFVDSPLSTKATDLVRKHPESFNEELRAYITTDPDPFGFENLTYIQDSEESKALNALEEPCVIISASGMADAGRVKHHIANSITQSKNTILLMGYCTPTSLAGKLLQGVTRVHIFGDYFDVKANIESIKSLSAHADYAEILRYLSCQDKNIVKKIFLVHGEAEAKTALQSRITTEGYKDVCIPLKSETYSLQ